MNLIEIIVIVACVIIVGVVTVKGITDKIKGKCSCGCDDCPSKNHCHKNKVK